MHRVTELFDLGAIDVQALPPDTTYDLAVFRFPSKLFRNSSLDRALMAPGGHLRAAA